MMGWHTPPEKFIDVTKLERVASVLEGKVAIQKWIDRDYIKF